MLMGLCGDASVMSNTLHVPWPPSWNLSDSAIVCGEPGSLSSMLVHSRYAQNTSRIPPFKASVKRTTTHTAWNLQPQSDFVGSPDPMVGRYAYVTRR